LCIFSILGILAGCTTGAVDLNVPSGIDFEYFYRGFTPLTEDSDMDAFCNVLGARVILTEDDWHDFAQRFCPTAGAFLTPDFSLECIIADSSLYGSRASENTSSTIEKIEIENNAIVITYGDDPYDRVYAINANGFGHWYVNIVKVASCDLPLDVEGVYRAMSPTER